MRAISDTIARLHAASGLSMQGMTSGPSSGGGHLRALSSFGSNPGALKAWYHVPEARTDMPLVVVLHGCTQTAAGYDRGAGWSDLADRHGFAVLLPEQQRTNNPNLCFNWFVEDDVRRGSGEVASIRQMVAAMVAAHAIDPARIFVTGLSAGGAMASAMLATHPEVFAGGAIIAGLPFGAAGSVAQALDRMRGHGHDDAASYARRVRTASSHTGAWPTIAVWHGTADRTVDVANAQAIVGQWRSVHGTATVPDRKDIVFGQSRHTWLDRDGRPAIVEYRIAGMGHGTPLATTGPEACGEPTAYMLDAGISSTWQIASDWGLISADAAPRTARAPRTPPAPVASPASYRPATPAGTAQDVIESALRSAGLMR